MSAATWILLSAAVILTAGSVLFRYLRRRSAKRQQAAMAARPQVWPTRPFTLGKGDLSLDDTPPRILRIDRPFDPYFDRDWTRRRNSDNDSSGLLTGMLIGQGILDEPRSEHHDHSDRSNDYSHRDSDSGHSSGGGDSGGWSSDSGGGGDFSGGDSGSF